MLKINIHIDDETRISIKKIYGKDDYSTVAKAVNDIVDRYLNVEYLDPELSTEETGDYKVCEFCEEKAKHSRMVDTDGTNLEEHTVCENCGSGYPKLI